jgi:hypothetical protein
VTGDSFKLARVIVSAGRQADGELLSVPPGITSGDETR